MSKVFPALKHTALLWSFPAGQLQHSGGERPVSKGHCVPNHRGRSPSESHLGKLGCCLRAGQPHRGSVCGCPLGATPSCPTPHGLICFASNFLETGGSVEAEKRGSCQRLPCDSALMNLIRLPVAPVPLPTACVLVLIYRHHVHLSQERRLAQIKARRLGGAES